MASLRRKPYESALLFGLTGMFFFSIPANYYYVVLALVPALLLRAAATAPARARRLGEYGAFVAFVAFWIATLLAPRMWGDDIVYNHFICVAFLAFMVVWMAAWNLPYLAAVSRPRQAGLVRDPLAGSGA
jgi:hypothetical protein